jgi:hypothetical protein
VPFRNAFFFSKHSGIEVFVRNNVTWFFHNQHSYNRKPWELKRNGSSALWVVYSNKALCVFDTVQFAKAWTEWWWWLPSGETRRNESPVMMAILVCGLLRYDNLYSRRFSQKFGKVRDNRWLPPARVCGIITHGTTICRLSVKYSLILCNLINLLVLACATCPWVRGPAMFVKKIFLPLGPFHSNPGAANWHNTHAVYQVPFV